MTNKNHGIIPAYETVSDSTRGDVVDSYDIRPGFRYLAEELGNCSYRVVRIEKPAVLPRNQRWLPGVYAINYEPGVYPEVLMPDHDGWDLISADGIVYNPSEGDVVTLLAPSGEAVAGVDGFAQVTHQSVPVDRRLTPVSKAICEVLAELDEDNDSDRLLMGSLTSLVREHLRERDTDDIRAAFNADVFFTSAAAPARLTGLPMSISRTGDEAHKYVVARGSGQGPASTWVAAFLYGLAYSSPVAD